MYVRGCYLWQGQGSLLLFISRGSWSIKMLDISKATQIFSDQMVWVFVMTLGPEKLENFILNHGGS